MAASDVEYMEQLDSLRAIAVLSVMWSHWLPHEYQVGLPWGQFGVQLFFVMSGFLITGILVRAGQSAGPRRKVLTAFFMRRVLRIVPVYYALLLVLYAIDFDTTRDTIGWHLAFGTNVWAVWFNSYASWLIHFWSLAVEEQFYLVWPFVVLFLPRSFVVAVCYTLITVACVSRAYLGLVYPDQITDVLLPANADALACGALLALAPAGALPAALKPRWLRVVVSVFVITQLFVLLNYDALIESVRRTCMVLCFAWIVHRAATGVGGRTGWLLSQPLLRYIGMLSYAMYLFHNLMMPAWFYWRPHISSQLVPWLDHVPLLRAAIMLLVTLLLAWFSRVLIERPCLRLKAWFPY